MASTGGRQWGFCMITAKSSSQSATQVEALGQFRAKAFRHPSSQIRREEKVGASPLLKVGPSALSRVSVVTELSVATLASVAPAVPPVAPDAPPVPAMPAAPPDPPAATAASPPPSGTGWSAGDEEPHEIEHTVRTA